MSDALHDRILELLAESPALVLELWAAADPLYRELIDRGWVARVHSNSGRFITHKGEDRPRRVDLVITLHPADDPHGPPKIVLVVECQLTPDEDKFFVWFEYLATMRAKHECGARLLVLSPMDAVLIWAHGLFDDEPWARPPLIGREHVPRIDDHGRALREIQLAVLSAAFHGPHEGGHEVVSAVATALRSLPRHRRERYIMLLRDALPEELMREIDKVTFEEAQAIAEEWIRTRASYQIAMRKGREEGLAAGRQEGLEKGWQEGLEEGRLLGELEGNRKALALVFELRGLQPSAAEQATIDSCTDIDTLARWCERAKTATAVADIFD